MKIFYFSQKNKKRSSFLFTEKFGLDLTIIALSYYNIIKELWRKSLEKGL